MSGGAGSDAAAAEGNERSDKEAGEDSLVIDEAESNDADSDEKAFEPTADMMMDDFDDEQTLEEEEAMEGGGGTDDEVNALEQESELPLEELLKLYNYDGRGNRSKEKSGHENHYQQQVPDAASEKDASHRASRPKADLPKLSQEAVEKRLRNSSGDEEVDREETPEKTKTGFLSPPNKKCRSELVKFYEGSVEGRSLRSSAAGGQGGDEVVEDEESDSGGEDSEGDGDVRDYSWKKTIMIGPAFQASVPVGLSNYEKDALPYENEDKLLWDPHYVSEREAEVFLGNSQESVQANGVGSLPLGAHIRDDEQALYLLLQCGYNCEEALRRRRMNSVPPADTMSLWSEEECRAFELGLRLYGKDFHMIQQQKVRTRSVGELVQFYYLWKKTERHDVFATATRLEKKKYTLHPGTTDYMDRFIDEQDRDRSSSPTYQSVLFKKQLSENGDNCSPDTSPSSILASGSGSSVQPVPPIHLEEANFQ